MKDDIVVHIYLQLLTPVLFDNKDYTDNNIHDDTFEVRKMIIILANGNDDNNDNGDDEEVEEDEDKGSSQIISDRF